MADATIALGALGLAVIVLSAVVVFGAWLHLDAAREWRAERSELLNRVLTDTPRDFAIVQKATKVKPENHDPVEPEHVLIGMS